MSVNIKINGQTVNDIHAVQFENADAPGTNIQFYDVNSVQEEKIVTPTTSVQEVVPSSEKLLSKVTVDAVTAAIDANIQAGNIKSGVTILGVTGTVVSNNKFDMLVDRSITTVTADDLAGVTSIGGYAFDRCPALTSVTVPDNVTSVGYQAFYSCPVLTSVTLGNGVTSIGNYAFSGCTGLTSVTIGRGITSIGTAVFRSCSGLTSVSILAVTPPALSNANAFDGTNNCPIYVPAGSVDAYKSETNWSSLASRIQAIPS